MSGDRQLWLERDPDEEPIDRRNPGGEFVAAVLVLAIIGAIVGVCIGLILGAVLT